VADEPSLTRLAPAARHRVVAAGFTEAAEAISDWSAPTPVAEWAAVDVVRHLVSWFPAFLEGGAGVTLPPGPPVDADPAGAWRHQAASTQALLEDPSTAGRMLTNPHVGEVPLPEAVDRFYTMDVFMHAWDLARAAGSDHRLDQSLCAELLAGMESMEGPMRDSGQYGPRVVVADDAPVQDRLLGFIGRDPAWPR